MGDLSGKVAVVTGAASGIGYALAETWVSKGMRVVLADIEEDVLEKAADMPWVRTSPFEFCAPAGYEPGSPTRRGTGSIAWAPLQKFRPMKHRKCSRRLRSLVESGMEPAEVARQVFSAVRDDRFWVLPNAERFGDAIKDTATSAVAGRTPLIGPVV